MQNFTLHTHNNELKFDGRANAQTMIQQAQDLNFDTIGVSNHIILHDNLTPYKKNETMFFDNFDTALDCYKKHIEILENLKSKFKINIKIGFEVDFFSSATWRNKFEKMIKDMPTDYLIGSNHFVKNKDESFVCNIYHLKHLSPQLDEETLHQYTINHFKNIIECIKSGYFNFIAHMDYCTIKGLGDTPIYDEYKYQIIEALNSTRTPIELNTSGYNRINRPHPDTWILKELAKANKSPILISDDAHFKEEIGQHFNKAETLLNSLNYTNRFTLDMLKRKF